ncbi:MAG: FprA family A-type flavoprotein, partial [Planctomycetota bacterium]|nr:FprA family A-type flavoprotein [Planctomycetota bacterium]
MRKNLFPDIDWIGAIDWNVRDFHSYTTNFGATYNSFLIRDGQNAIIDTVKAPFFDAFFRQAAALASPESIRYIVCNHAEPDHSSGLPRAVAAFPNAEIVATGKCRETVNRYFGGESWKWRLVKTGDSLGLGKHTLSFIETPMVHWPDSMMTHVPELGLLFSMDAFGQHFAGAARFDDETDSGAILDEAKTYYANIVAPHGKAVQRALDRLKGLGINMIATSHGVVWRKNVQTIVSAYRDWASHKTLPKVAVFYDSMWESTGRIAEAVIQGAAVPGVETVLLHVRHSNLTRIATEFLDAAAFAFGSATLNNLPMPQAAAALNYLRGMNLPEKTGFAFGSHGWSGRTGADLVEEQIKAAGWAISRPVLKCPYRPSSEILSEAEAAGRELARIARSAATGS